MKKLTIGIIAILAIIILGTTMVGATTANNIDAIYAIASKYGMSSSDKVKLERYVSDNSITESQTANLLDSVKNAESIVKAEGVKSYKELTASKKAELKTIANNAAASVGATVAYSTGKVEIYKYGKLVDAITSDDGKLAYTGSTSFAVAGIAIVLIAAAVVIIKKKNI